MHAVEPILPAANSLASKDEFELALRLAQYHKCPFNIRTCPGCTSPNQLRHDSSLRMQHELLFWQTMADIAGLRSPKLNWEQLKQAFVNSYWSTGVMTFSKGFLTVFQYLAPHSTVMDAARDALCLIHLGARYRDQRLLLEGRKRHLAALKCMQEEVGKPDAAFDDCFLAAAYTIGHCEVYKEIAQNGKGWIAHIPNFQRILEIRGPKSINSRFAHALLHCSRQVSITDSFMNRKGSYLASPEWIACAEEIDSPAVKATNMALGVGVALEEADLLRSSARPSQSSIVSLLGKMVELEDKLQQWLVDVYKWSHGDLTPHKLVPTSSFTSFNERCGPLAGICPWSIEFPSFLSATTHSYIWICLILLRQAIADVAKLHSYPLLRPMNQEKVLAEAINECAESLCQSIAYLSNADHGFAGILATGGPLYFASEWYKRKQDAMRLLWMNHVRDFLHRDVLLGGSLNTSLDLQKPVFTWWMLPDIFAHSQSDKQTLPQLDEQRTVVEEME